MIGFVVQGHIYSLSCLQQYLFSTNILWPDKICFFIQCACAVYFNARFESILYRRHTETCVSGKRRITPKNSPLSTIRRLTPYKTRSCKGHWMLSVLCQTSHLLLQKRRSVEKAGHCDEIIGWMRNIVKFKLIPAHNAIITSRSLSLSVWPM